MSKEAGYAYGINPGLLLFDLCKEYGIQEVSIYGFTQDNNKRPSIQQQAFRNACVTYALEIARRGAALLVVGDETSTQFPRELQEFRHRQGAGMKVNPSRQLWLGMGPRRSEEWRPPLRSSFTHGFDCAVGRRPPLERFSPGAIGVCRFLCQRRILA
jgi:Putative undecaprenyl diphosphate synthase